LLLRFKLWELLLTAAFREPLVSTWQDQSKLMPQFLNDKRTSFIRCNAPIMVSIVASDIPLIYSIRTRISFTGHQTVQNTSNNKTYRFFGVTAYLSQALEVWVHRGLLHLGTYGAGACALTHRHGALPVVGLGYASGRHGTSLTIAGVGIGNAAIVDAMVTPHALLVVRVSLAVTDPGQGGNRADAEPDEAGGTTEHISILVVAVPMPMVGVWHVKKERRVCCALSLGRDRMGFI
jgi:hypothetical protein